MVILLNKLIFYKSGRLWTWDLKHPEFRFCPNSLKIDPQVWRLCKGPNIHDFTIKSGGGNYCRTGPMDLVVNPPRQKKTAKLAFNPSRSQEDLFGAFQRQESGSSDMSRLVEGKAGGRQDHLGNDAPLCGPFPCPDAQCMKNYQKHQLFDTKLHRNEHWTGVKK